ncbi:unnamed protein product [Scytosiphon promiscuus]
MKLQRYGVALSAFRTGLPFQLQHENCTPSYVRLVGGCRVMDGLHRFGSSATPQRESEGMIGDQEDGSCTRPYSNNTGNTRDISDPTYYRGKLLECFSVAIS